MSEEHFDETDPRIQAALAELRGLIQSAYPMASFSIEHGEDPPGILPIATVDVDDVDEVVDVFISRLVDIQVDEGLPVYVIPVEPLERSLAKPRASHAGEPIAEHAALATG